MTTVVVRFTARERPLSPLAVAAHGDAVRALARRLLESDDATLAGLRGVAGPSVLVVLGEEARLPWARGVTYLGRDPEAPSLLLPTAEAPDVPVWLYERAVLRAAGPQATTPLAVIPHASILLPVSAARPMARARLLSLAE